MTEDGMMMMMIIIIIIIPVIPMTMFIVLPSWKAIARVHSVYAMNTARRQDQEAADLWTKPTYMLPVNRIHHRHLLLVLSPKSGTHFTVPRRVEG